jgi:Flp pilus assembly pilin Flp
MRREQVLRMKTLGTNNRYLIKQDKGAALAEYAILLMLLSVASLVSVKTVGKEVREIYTATFVGIEDTGIVGDDPTGGGPGKKPGKGTPDDGGTPGDGGAGPGPNGDSGGTDGGSDDGSSGDGSSGTGEAARLYPHIPDAVNWPDPSSCFLFPYREYWSWDHSETDPNNCFQYDSDSNARFTAYELNQDMFVYFHNTGILTDKSNEWPYTWLGYGNHTYVVDPPEAVRDRVNTPIGSKMNFEDLRDSSVEIDLDTGGTHEIYVPNYRLDDEVIVDKSGDGFYQLFFRNGSSLVISFGNPKAIHFRDRTVYQSELMAIPDYANDFYNVEPKVYGPNDRGHRRLKW